MVGRLDVVLEIVVGIVVGGLDVLVGGMLCWMLCWVGWIFCSVLGMGVVRLLIIGSGKVTLN